jgi:hypothetical protein
VISLWILIGFMVPNWFTPGGTDVEGQFGDRFGAANALFAGLAFAGLLWTIWQQREEIQQARVQTGIMQEELEALREEQKELQKLSAIAAEIQARASILDYYGIKASNPTQFERDKELEQKMKKEVRQLGKKIGELRSSSLRELEE